LHADGEIEVICPPSLGLLKAMRPQNIWFFLAAGEAGVGGAYQLWLKNNRVVWWLRSIFPKTA